MIVLNVGEENEVQGSVCHDLMGQLRKSIMKLKADFISDDGSSVDYHAMGKSPAFDEYKKLASQLRKIDLKPLESDVDERKAFFINLYNVLMIHALVAQEALPEAPTKIEGMWSNHAYDVGGLLFTLDEIEHGILRCNKGHPKDGKPMFDDEARKDLALKDLDPRIHFALNCGANSCPPIRVYQKEKLNQQLDMAARSFVNQDVEVIENESKVLMSKLLLWYGKDFGQTQDEILLCLSRFITDEKLKDDVKAVVESNKSEEKIIFRDYNWSLNSKQ